MVGIVKPFHYPEEDETPTKETSVQLLKNSTAAVDKDISSQAPEVVKPRNHAVQLEPLVTDFISPVVFRDKPTPQEIAHQLQKVTEPQQPLSSSDRLTTSPQDESDAGTPPLDLSKKPPAVDSGDSNVLNLSSAAVDTKKNGDSDSGIVNGTNIISLR